MDRLDSALARSERTQREVTVFFCDLDGFKRVNDVAGHAAGDQVLLEITRRLRSVLREGDTVARIGGDEFVILVEPWNRKSAVNGPGDPADDRAAAIRIAERIGAAVRRPITINGVEHGVSVSVGITHVGQSPTGSSRGTTAEEILQDADMAMYRAKSGGKDRFAIFEHGMRADVAQRAAGLATCWGIKFRRPGARAGRAAAVCRLSADFRRCRRRPDGLRGTRQAHGRSWRQHSAGRVHPHR
jgi:diguanylate cyclase (GGDEF)-like protein